MKKRKTDRQKERKKKRKNERKDWQPCLKVPVILFSKRHFESFLNHFMALSVWKVGKKCENSVHQLSLASYAAAVKGF